MRRTLLAAALPTMALAAPAAALTQNELDSFLAAVSAVECTIDVSTIGQVVVASGLDETALREVIVFLRENDGLAVTSSEAMRVVAGPCAG